MINLYTPAPKSSEQVVQMMYSKYHQQWFKTLTFTQHNEFYKGDTIAGTSIWYEAIEFPKNFRIDLGDLEKGNAVIFRNDSIYSFKGGEIKKAQPRKNNLTFLLGGMYFYSYNEVLDNLREEGYDISKGYKTKINGRKVWVIGANKANEKVNQLFIDLKNLYVMRVLTFDDGKKVEGVFEDHQKFDKGWCETKVTFYVDDTLYQVEYYKDVKVNVELPKDLFNPGSFGKCHWLTNK